MILLIFASSLFLLTRPLRDVTIHLGYHSVSAKAFLLTRPLRDVTNATYRWNGSAWISTHTPLAGRDEIVL